MILEINGISFTYNSHNVLKDLSFRTSNGELLAVLGPNGVGKSTLLKCLNAILQPREGSVMVDGRETDSMDPMEIARHFGYVAQNQQATRMTAFDAVLLGRRPHIRWKVANEDIEIVDAAMKRIGLTHLSLRYIDQMSGGELQKVAIARALVQEPELMLLDEPTSSLDLKNQVEIMNLIRRVVNEHSVAVIMTMHNLNMALRYAHKYLFLKDGSIYSAGNINEITGSMIEAVYGIPVELVYHKGNPFIIPLEKDLKGDKECLVR